MWLLIIVLRLIQETATDVIQSSEEDNVYFSSLTMSDAAVQLRVSVFFTSDAMHTPSL